MMRDSDLSAALTAAVEALYENLGERKISRVFIALSTEDRELASASNMTTEDGSMDGEQVFRFVTFALYKSIFKTGDHSEEIVDFSHFREKDS